MNQIDEKERNHLTKQPESRTAPDRSSGRKRRRAGKIGLSFASDMGKKLIGVYAGSITFFFFLSLIPLLILVTSFLPYTAIESKDLVSMITAFTPDIADGLVASMVYEAFSVSSSLLPIPLLVLVWSCAQAMLALIRGLNGVYNVKEHRSYLSLCLTAIIHTILMLTVLVSMMALSVFGGLIRKSLSSSIHISSQRAYSILAGGLSTGQALLLLLAAVLVFTLVYTFVPSGRRNPFYQLPGALFTTIAWQVFSFFFKLYINGTNKYTAFYGSLATLAILIFWMYCCIYILLLGGQINAFFRPVFRRYFHQHFLKDYTPGSRRR